MKDKFEMNIDIALPDIRRAKRAVKKAVKSVKYDVAAFRDRELAWLDVAFDLDFLSPVGGLGAALQEGLQRALVGVRLDDAVVVVLDAEILLNREESTHFVTSFCAS